ncbi:hypothetical protein ND2E_0912 [Colwellia psychrerythraea]|uniref:Uncharacterized protein n=1 Tax=Colwellia psychrerythraea TaxID=28229 RepID=A0A099K8Y3_COLPS|nr:hypothetical protein ND2E_0912 [Colwellia psychrerythraea]
MNNNQGTFFVNGYSLKNKYNDENNILRFPQRAGLQTLYATLLISTRKLPFSSINASPKGIYNSS